MREKLVEFFKNKSVLILGFGLEGKSTYKLLRELNCAKKIAVADRNSINENLDCEIYCGESYLEQIKNYDIIMKSPGIALFDSLDKKEKAKITSQTDLFLKFRKNKVIGITGTKGKSTVSSLIYHILINCGEKAVLVGNIGKPVLDDACVYDDDTVVVYELSCHQLEYVSASPDIAVLLNIYEEHLDHYTDYNAYVEAKFNVARFLKKSDTLIYNTELKNPIFDNLPCEKITASLEKQSDIMVFDDYIKIDRENIPVCRAADQSEKVDGSIRTRLIGTHNLYNIAVAIAASVYSSCNLAEAVQAIDSFLPLPHRLESLGIINGVEYINDSISTIPQAAINALKSLPDTDVLIIGGMDRGISYKDLIDYLKDSSLNALIALPGAGYRAADEIAAAYDPHFGVYRAKDMTDAVSYAKAITKKRCILSPAAASYDVYKNFEKRGEHFKELVITNP